MASRSLSLPRSKRDKHPTFSATNVIARNPYPPSYDVASDPLPGVNISPYGTWRPVADGHPSANIEVLDLSERYGYKPPMKPKARPKNALSRGLKPTKKSELPTKRTVYEISSGAEDDDDETISEPSPLSTKRRRLMSFSTRHQASVLEELQAAAAYDAAEVPNQLHRTATQQESGSVRRSPNPSLSSRTEQGGHDSNSTVVDPTQLPTSKGDKIVNRHPSTTNHAPSANSHHKVQSQSSPRISPQTFNNTTLRIYLPHSAARIYVPLKLRSCPTVHALFATVDKICGREERNYEGSRSSTSNKKVMFVEMRFDGKEEGGKGTMAVKRDVEGSFEWFLEELEAMNEKFKGEGEGLVGVGVSVEVGLR
ncbi:MAG: hypothetical protein Q9170_007806 [Blastenia crenularia]